MHGQTHQVQAHARRDGSAAELRTSQLLELAILKLGPELSKVENLVVNLIRVRQFQFADDKGKPQPIGLEEFQGILQADRRTIFRALRRLIAMGLIRRLSGSGRGHLSTYALIPPRWIEVADVTLKVPNRKGGTHAPFSTPPNRGAHATLSAEIGAPTPPLRDENVTLSGAPTPPFTPPHKETRAFSSTKASTSSSTSFSSSTPRASAHEEQGSKDPDDTTPTMGFRPYRPTLDGSLFGDGHPGGPKQVAMAIPGEMIQGNILTAYRENRGRLEDSLSSYELWAERETGIPRARLVEIL